MAKRTVAQPEAVKHRHAFYARLKAIGAEYCATCAAYLFPSHTCLVFDLGESMRAYGWALASLDFTPDEAESDEVAA